MTPSGRASGRPEDSELLGKDVPYEEAYKAFGIPSG